MRGTLCSQGGGGGNDGAAGTCVWGSVAGCASLRGSFGKGRGTEREREMLGIFLQSLLLSLPQPERGRGRHQKISFPVGAQWPPWLLIVPFIPSLHPCLFSLLLNGAIQRCTLLCRSCFIPACTVFKTAFSTHPQSWFFICATSLG